jgi:hypothetical protein
VPTATAEPPRRTRPEPKNTIKRKPLNQMTLADLKRCLSPKQLQFAEALANGGVSKRKSYLQAYNVKEDRNPARVATDATELSQNPKIARTIDLIRQARENPALRDASQTRAFVLANLAEMAAETEHKDRLASTIALGKTVGLFVDRKEIIHREAGAETEREIIGRLNAIMAQFEASDAAGAIDATFEAAEQADQAEPFRPAGTLGSIDKPALSLERLPRRTSEFEPDLDPDL